MPDSENDARFNLHFGDALEAYGDWSQPACIISDGAYGVGGFPGDPRTPETLGDWYRPHIEAWSAHAHPSSTLWFWNTEVGWATVHPLLEAAGWGYEQTITWDKGVGHVAGNVNSRTIRRFPVVTEVCIFYSRKLTFRSNGDEVPARDWMRSEWKRSGLPLRAANAACGVKDAATRKYFAQDWLWYFPPPEMMERLVSYANEHGDPAGRPYYSIDGRKPVSGAEWGALRYRWNHQHGITNVWSHPALRNSERFKGTGKRHAPRVHKPTAGVASAHLNQKPLEIMHRIINACTQPGDVIWEPFGGLCSAVVAAVELGRRGFAAEPYPDFFDLATERLNQAVGGKGQRAPDEAAEPKDRRRSAGSLEPQPRSRSRSDRLVA